jgi:hypothetical protein
MSYLYVYDQDQELIAALFLGEELAEIEQTARYGPDYWTNIAQELEKVLTGYLGRIKCVTS